ncbi:phytosulfokine receptor 1 [Cannabis sativa]|uniref:phytosulfokine receptor 1 n=1 Tax=Cannabis sativa TaxID=3483 RepID=UPI0029C9F8B1|nr:phytosulfokine receptor 1 [Cannabis sativa]
MSRLENGISMGRLVRLTDPNKKFQSFCDIIATKSSLSVCQLKSHTIHFLAPKMGFSNFCLAFLILVLSFKVSILTSQNLSCNMNDLEALSGFQSCLGSAIEGWDKSTSSDCCTWTGVTCSDDHLPIGRRIVGLELDNKRLTGKVCESLSGLDQLKILNLSHNYLSGSLEDEDFRFYNLEILDLSNNEFTGTIAASIFEVSTLKILDLSQNHFYGEIPNIFGNSTSLQVLSLQGNDLSGNLPESVFQLHNLTELQLGDNSFSGKLSDGIGNLSNLVKLDISFNLFSGSLPDIFNSLGKLEHLYAASNNFTGHLPPSLINSKSLMILNINNNSLDGLINLNCTAMVNLISIDLGSNFFQGPLPEQLFTCWKLISINLSRNKFNSVIPSSYKNFQSLSYFSISNASIYNISTALEVLQHCKNLSMVFLTMNFAEEEIPYQVNFQFKSLEVFVMANSQLRGKIPDWLSGCTKLQLLDLSWNNLWGTIPPWIGKLDFLFYLDLSNNSLSEEIPETLTELKEFKKEFNFSVVPILTFPVYTYREGSKGFKYKKMSNLRPSLVLSDNNLSGPIWPTFGNLKMLHVMDLKRNSLSGIIPKSFSGLKNLEKLDLSENKLSGSIPDSLLELHFLSNFNVSYNMLSGKIPSGGQFDTFPFSSFIGNKGLWGFNFFSSGVPKQHHSTSQVYPNINGQIIDFGLVFHLGTVTGFVISVTICFISGWVFQNAGKKKKER